MAVNADVFELVSILDRAGFTVLAGEILIEIGLGEEQDDDEGLDDYPAKGSPAEPGKVSYLGERPVTRVPIPAGQQLKVALEIVRLRLVEPMKRYAEAEIIAGEIRSPDEQKDASSKRDIQPIRIIFAPEGPEETGSFAREEGPGEAAEAEALNDVLDRLLKTLPDAT